jgi:hypothetical protein
MIKNFKNFKNTKIISAFPGCGKTHLFKNTDLIILDSDSSKFDKKHFPDNYIKHIKENIGKVDIILVSSHDVVRKALVENDIFFYLIYPNIELKDDYIDRYKERGSPENFINLLDSKWIQWITEVENQSNCFKIELSKNQYLSDILDIIYEN